MNIRLVDGEGTIFGPNAVKAGRDDKAPIINLHASFVFDKTEVHSPYAFPSLVFGDQMLRAALKAREQAGLSVDLSEFAVKMALPLQISEEWAALQAGWSLAKNNQNTLSQVRLAKFFSENKSLDKPDHLADWVFQFASRLTQPFYEKYFEAVFLQLQEAIKSKDFDRFASYYNDSLSEDHGRRYFALIKSYFELFTDFSQVHYLVTAGICVGDDFAATSANFHSARMFYGNAFEDLGSNVVVFALLNNLIQGRKFDEFAQLSLDGYLKLDKSGRFNPFSTNKAFADVCSEADNQIRNASHHGGMSFERSTGLINYRAGKGGRGPVHTLSYASYLSKCSIIFVQSMVILKLELLIADRFKVRHPL